MFTFGSRFDLLFSGFLLCGIGGMFLYSGWRAANLEDESETAQAVRESVNPIALFTIGAFLVVAGLVAVLRAQGD